MRGPSYETYSLRVGNLIVIAIVTAIVAAIVTTTVSTMTKLDKDLVAATVVQLSFNWRFHMIFLLSSIFFVSILKSKFSMYHQLYVLRLFVAVLLMSSYITPETVRVNTIESLEEMIEDFFVVATAWRKQKNCKLFGRIHPNIVIVYLRKQLICQ